MADFTTDKVNGQTVSATEYNQITTEGEAIITAGGLTPSNATLTQQAQSITRHTAGADYYLDSGAVNAYVLTLSNSFVASSSYFDGMRVRFITGNTNTGASTVNVSTLGIKNIRKIDGTALTGGEILANKPIELTYKSGADYFVVANGFIVATNTNIGVSYLPNPIGIVKSTSTIINFLPGTFRTSLGTQIYVPSALKIIQSSGSWTAGNNQNGLDTGARASNTFYYSYVIQNNTTLATDYLLSASPSSPIIPSGWTNLGIIDYGVIRVNGSNNIADAIWHPNDKKIILVAGDAITIVNGTAGAGNVAFITSTLPIEFGIITYLNTIQAGNSDFAVYGSDHDSSNPLDCVVITTNNGFATAGNGLIYTSNGRIYWKNFNISGGISSQICKVKSIKIRS